MSIIKKTLAIGLALLLLTACFWGCQSKEHEPYKTIIISARSDKYAIYDLDPSERGVFVKENMPDRQFTVLGETYDMSYSHSCRYASDHGFYWRPYMIDSYHAEPDVSVSVRCDTGELVSFFNSEAQHLPGIDNPKETAMTIAETLASTLVEDLSEYSDVSVKEAYFAHEITYAKPPIQGYPSSAYIMIDVANSGGVQSIRVGDTGLNNDDVRFVIDKENVNQSIVNRVTAAYEDAGYAVSKVDIYDQEIVRTVDGDFCVLSEVGLDFSSDSVPEYRTYLFTLTTVG